MSIIKISLIALGMLCFGVSNQSATAKKGGSHISGVANGPEIYIRPELQDLSTTSIVVNKTIFEDYTPVETTLTLNLVQDHRGIVRGTAAFVSRQGATAENASIPVTGKTKTKKNEPEFSLKGSALINGTSTVLNLKAVQTAFTATEDHTTEALSLATYRFTVKISGLSRKYNYIADQEISGRFHFGYEFAPDSAEENQKPSEKSDYYYLYAPWGGQLGLGVGKFQVKDGNGILNIKGPKIKLIATDFGNSGQEPFVTDHLKLKTAVGKFEGTLAD